MATEEGTHEKKNKDNVIPNPKNPRRPAPFRLLDVHSNPTVFRVLYISKDSLSLSHQIRRQIMPVVDGKKYPYTKKGKAAAKKAKKKKNNPNYNISKNIGY